MYMIRSLTEREDTGEALYWSNEQGWVPSGYADEYTIPEREVLTLPDGGIWDWED